MNITEILEQATVGLTMPSESEYPFDSFVWTNQSSFLLVSDLCKITNHAPDSLIQSIDLQDFFSSVSQEQAWHNEIQKADVPKFQALIETLQTHLSNIQVFLVGEVEIDVYIVGQCLSGELAGLHTRLIET